MDVRTKLAPALLLLAAAGCAGAAPAAPAAATTPAGSASPTTSAAPSATPRKRTPPPTVAPTPTTPLSETTERAGSQPEGSTRVVLARLAFEPGTESAIEVQAGKVVLYLDNTSFGAPHNMAIAASADGPVLARSGYLSHGQSAIFTVDDLPTASYFIFCEVGGHRQAGMVGTLVAETP
jgi:plastocyanin